MLEGGISIVTGRGTVVSSEAMHAVDHLLDMSKQLNQWDFIELIIKTWSRRNPDLAASYQSASKNELYRGEMRNRNATTADGGSRKLIDVPQNLWDTIGFFYPDEVKDKKFINDFGNRFPAFRVAENKL